LTQIAAATAASSEINWSAGTEVDTGGEEDAAGEPGRVVAISAGTEAEIVEILEKRES